MTSKCLGCRDGAALEFSIRAAFQPIVDLGTQAPYAYEALVRGPAGEGAATVLAQVTATNRYAFDQACRVAAIREAVAAGLLDTESCLSINFLPNAVYSPVACIQLTLQTAREVGLPPERLIFEFTENEKIDPDHLRGIVHAYRKMGFRTAIDDFGAGHSGLALLADLQTDIIKLDMDLVRGIDESLPRRIILEGILNMTAKLGIRVVAEGVETESELAALQSLGVRYVQGYLLAKPALGALPKIHNLRSSSAKAA
ncbi:MAG TPA: EAL domain-containing protein [Vicinamibacterales bacterium]|nr:EAL domain-containing protein [Vicinamibacterales bacterium]